MNLKAMEETLGCDKIIHMIGWSSSASAAVYLCLCERVLIKYEEENDRSSEK